MKKMKIFALIVLAGATIFTSCKKDETTTLADPTISFQGGTNSLVFNGTNAIDVNVTVAAEGKIETVSLQGPSLSGTGTTTTPITALFGTSGTDNAKNQTSAIYMFQVSSANLALALVNHTTGFTYTFTVTDQEGKSTTATFTVTVPSASGTPFGTFSSVTTAQIGAQAATPGSFYNSASNAVYTTTPAATNSSLVDFCYYYGATNNASLSAPSNTDAQSVFSGISAWATKNATKIEKMAAGFNFTGLSSTTDISAITFNTSTQATNLQVGDVIAFKTVGNKIGFAKIASMSATTSAGIIVLDVKVQN